MKLIKKSLLLAVAGLQLAGFARTAFADLPVSGRPVPKLELFDSLMNDYMENNDLWAGVLGIMKDGKIVYLRGFGYCFDDKKGYGYDYSKRLPENALFRLASCTKPITAAAVRQQVAAGQYSLRRKAFDLDPIVVLPADTAVGGTPTGPGDMLPGLLDATAGSDYEPFPRLGTRLLQDITIQNLITMTAGWDRDATGDLTYEELQIVSDMGLKESPPGRANTVRWILGQPLQNRPGQAQDYCNICYLLMGLIVEQYSGMDLVSYVRQNVLTPDMWIPSTEIQGGHTFRENDEYGSQDKREPYYDSDETDLEPSVFSHVPGDVLSPYGSWDLEARIGQGGFVASAPTMLECLQRYHVNVFGPNVGQPIDTTYPLNADEAKDGALDGVSTYAVQRTDGVNVFIAFNQKYYAPDFYDLYLKIWLDAFDLFNFEWPTDTCDGFWIEPVLHSDGGVGGYDDPFQGVDAALDYCKDGSKLRFKAGSSSWTGAIQTRVLIDAPLGAAIIGR